MRYSLFLLTKWRLPFGAGKKSSMEIEIPAMNLPKELARNVEAKTAENEEFEEEIVPVSQMQESYQTDIDFNRARSFLKHVKPYQPPVDLEQKISDVVREYSSKSKISSIDADWRLISFGDDANLKFQILVRMEKLFGKTVPNSYLHEIKTMQDVVDYYKQSFNIVAAYNQMARNREQAPTNLHIVEECVRYDPARDGETAFPKRDVKVYNQRYKKLYKELKAKKEWHEFQNKRTRYGSPENSPWDPKAADTMDRIGDWRKSGMSRLKFW